MNKLAVLQDGYVSEVDRTKICSFDNEVIEKPTRPLIHQAARFLYFKKGYGNIIVDGINYKIIPNTIIAIIPWEISDITEVLETLQFKKIIYDYSYINNSLKNTSSLTPDDSIAELFQIMSKHPALYLNDYQAKKMDMLFDDLENELGIASTLDERKPKPLSELFVSNKIIEIMILCERSIYESKGKELDKEPGIVRSQGKSILTYIYAHSSDGLTLEKLSKVFYMSESSISKHIMDLTGVSFINILNDIRIEKATDYLIHTDLSLNDIANLLGFVDASHISKHFQSSIGISPMEYRKIYQHLHKKTVYSHNSKEYAYLITDYLYKNYMIEKLNCNKVAQKFGLSSVEVNKALLYYTEKNFDNLLNFIRINKACELLASTEDQILYVALDVGYSNVKTFNLNFIKYKNMTPSNFRKNVTLQYTDGSETTNVERKNKE
jgi:AraC-like DNA-binding protein